MFSTFYLQTFVQGADEMSRAGALAKRAFN